MARISEVIHVKGTDGEVRECALFDSSSDIPSPAEAREFGLDGAKIYGAVLRGNVFLVGTDEEWLYANSGTELVFHDGSSELSLLTTPYFVRPKAETLEFGADGGTVYLEDYSFKTATHEGILSTNGTLSGYICDRDFISFVNAGQVLSPAWTVVCEANTSADERTFTLALTFLFADGSTRDITFSGTQAAAGSSGGWGGTGDTRTLTINITKSGRFTVDSDWSGTNAPMVTVLADGASVIGMCSTTSTSMTWTGEVDYGATAHYEVSKDGYVTVTGSVTMDGDKTVSVRLSPDNNN